MKSPILLAFLFGLGPFAAGCWSDRPLYSAETPDASASAQGAAGASGAAGRGGPGAAGAQGGMGTDGGGPVQRGCDQAIPTLQHYSCGLVGCHGGTDPAAGFSLDGLTDNPGENPGHVDWRAKLVGVHPSGGGSGGIKSMCGSAGIPYLVAGSSPATGLFLDKLLNTAPVCGAAMPNIGGPLTAAEKDCVQRWANALTAP